MRVSSARGILHPSPPPPSSSSSSSSSLHRNNRVAARTANTPVGLVHSPLGPCPPPCRRRRRPPPAPRTFAVPESRVFPLSARHRSLLYTFVAPADGIRYRSVRRDPTRSNAIQRDPTRSNAIQRDPTRSKAPPSAARRLSKRIAGWRISSPLLIGIPACARSLLTGS
jgi:hypothetical protein